MRVFRRRWKGLLAVIGIWTTLSQAQAASFVEQVSPPSFERGKTTRVSLIGSELEGATGVWSSLPGQEIEVKLVEPSRPDQATFDFTLRPDAPLGLYGLRLATRSGLSNVKLFLIDDLPTVAERESNPTDAPQPLRWPVAVLGKARDADLDRFSIDVDAGQRLSFEVVGNRLGQDFDPLLTIKDASGRRVIDRDNDVGLMFDCRFAHTFDKAGTYTIEIQDTRYRGSEHTAYVLRIGRFPEGRVGFPSTIRAGDSVALSVPGTEHFVQEVAIPKDARLGGFFQAVRRAEDQGSAWLPLEVSPYANTLESEPNDDPRTATPTMFPTVVHGILASPDDRDAFAFELSKGQRLTAQIECRAVGSPADLDVVLLDPEGKTVKRLDTLPDGAAALSIDAKAPGRHVVLVRSLTQEGGPEYAYRITIAVREPTFQLISEASGLAIPRGSYQILPLALTRTDFAGPVALELRGAPPGMALRHDVIREGETALDNAIVVGPDVPEGLYSVQLEARTQVAGQEIKALATTLPLIDRRPSGRGPHGEPFELREDQRRLPPSLTNRIAILVTSSSPFTFELPEPTVVLPRYLEAKFRIETTRVPGFDGPITFTAQGGSLDPLNLQKPRVKSEIPPATLEQQNIEGILRSGVNSELRKQRVTVTAHAAHEGRAIDLTRTFELRTQVAFEPAAEPQRIEIKAGESATVALRGNRLPPFAGPIAIRPSGAQELRLPDTVELAEGADQADLKLVVPSELKPGTYRIEFSASAHVSKFDEVVKGKPIEVVVVKPTGDGS